jgi:hypothetical protein
MKKKKQPQKRERPLSMHPLKPSEALAAFMKIDKKKLLGAEQEIKTGENSTRQ